MSRTGRPGWAVVATAVLFLLTTALAVLVSRQKFRGAEIHLGPPQPYKALNLQASFPIGWEVSAAERLTNGQVVLATPADAEAGRHLFLFRVRPTVLGPRQVARAPVWALQAVDPSARFGKAEVDDAGSLGGLESQMYRLIVEAPALGPGLQLGLANVAVTPDRQVLGVLLVINGRMTNRDRRLVQEVSDRISYEPRPRPSAQETDEPETSVDESEAEQITPEPTDAVEFIRRQQAAATL